MGNSQTATTTNNSYENSEFRVFLTLSTEKDTILNNTITIINKSIDPILIFKDKPRGSFELSNVVLFNISLEYERYAHFPNDYLFNFYILKKDESIVFSKKSKKKQNELIELDFIFSYISLKDIESKKTLKKLNKNIKFNETKISKKCLTKIKENKKLIEFFIEFQFG